MTEEGSSFYKEGFDDKWSTYKYMTDVQSDIKKDITSDFILAKLKNDNAPEPIGIIELVRDGYFCKKMLERYIDSWTYQVGKNGKYIRNKDGTFKKFPLSDESKRYIKNVAEVNFNVYMVKVIMTVIMYRNIKDNVLMELITEKDRLSGETEGLKKENEELMKKMSKNIKKGEENK